MIVKGPSPIIMTMREASILTQVFLISAKWALFQISYQTSKTKKVTITLKKLQLLQLLWARPKDWAK